MTALTEMLHEERMAPWGTERVFMAAVLFMAALPEKLRQPALDAANQWPDVDAKDVPGMIAALERAGKMKLTGGTGA